MLELEHGIVEPLSAANIKESQCANERTEPCLIQESVLESYLGCSSVVLRLTFENYFF